MVSRSIYLCVNLAGDCDVMRQQEGVGRDCLYQGIRLWVISTLSMFSHLLL